MKTREVWLDYLRAFACCLVTLGHLLLSFQTAGITKDSIAATVFVDFIYCFHVYIFFFCSGYLFQKSQSQVASPLKAWHSRLEKCMNFLILYIVFSAVTYLFKRIFSSDVNSAVEGGFLEILLKEPINQMWYLYAISIIFLFAHFIRSKTSQWLILSVSLGLKIIICIPSLKVWIPTPVDYLFDNLIWFVLGQWVAYKPIKPNWPISLLLAGAFCGLFAFSYGFQWDSAPMNALLTFLGLSASVGIVALITEKRTLVFGIWKYLSKYMLQIYLLHTIFAAGIRVVLLKLGVTHFIPHFILGLAFSFIPPILCAVIAEKAKILNLIFFPIKTLKALRSNSGQDNK